MKGRVPVENTQTQKRHPTDESHHAIARGIKKSIEVRKRKIQPKRRTWDRDMPAAVEYPLFHSAMISAFEQAMSLIDDNDRKKEIQKLESHFRTLWTWSHQNLEMN